MESPQCLGTAYDWSNLWVEMVKNAQFQSTNISSKDGVSLTGNEPH